ncbi:MAG: DUF6266 family protein [Paludibacter sp.]|nr:DUF6266 family protein [Paludibacter sp.]
MAKFNSTTFGTISGGHGSAVAATTKDGQNILRIYKAPSNPNTPAQVVQRGKIGFVNTELSPLRDIFKVTYRNNKGMNLAVSYALRNAITSTSPNFALDYSNICFAWGSIQLPEQTTATPDDGNTIRFDWDTTLRKKNEDPDELNVILMNENSKFTILRERVSLRDAATTKVSVPAIWAGTEVHCWIYFSTPENNLTSVSKYLGLLQLKSDIL